MHFMVVTMIVIFCAAKSIYVGYRSEITSRNLFYSIVSFKSMVKLVIVIL